MNEKDREYLRHLRNALSNYTGGLDIIGRFDQEVPLDLSEPMRNAWVDEPLLLLGEYVGFLDLSEEEVKGERDKLREMI